MPNCNDTCHDACCNDLCVGPCIHCGAGGCVSNCTDPCHDPCCNNLCTGCTHCEGGGCVDNCPDPGSPPPCKKWDCNSCSWVDKCPPVSCPPECVAGAGITDTKVLVNGAEVMGGWDDFCSGVSYEITATAGSDPYDIMKYYKFDCETCECVHDHDENVPGTVTRTGPVQRTLTDCPWKVISYEYTWTSECGDAPVTKSASVRIRNCTDELFCCLNDDECQDHPACVTSCWFIKGICLLSCPGT